MATIAAACLKMSKMAVPRNQGPSCGYQAYQPSAGWGRVDHDSDRAQEWQSPGKGMPL